MIKMNLELFFNICILFVGGFFILNINVGFVSFLLLGFLAIICYFISCIHLFAYLDTIKPSCYKTFMLKKEHFYSYNRDLYIYTTIFCYSNLFLLFNKTLHNDSHFIKDLTFSKLLEQPDFFSQLFVNSNFGYILLLDFCLFFVLSTAYQAKMFFFDFIKD